MRIGDVDFTGGVVSIHEKKRAHGRRMPRTMPLSTSLAAILKEWLAILPGGALLFAHAEEVRGSKNRSHTTGHLWKDRPGVMKEREAGLKEGKTGYPTLDRGRGPLALQTDTERLGVGGDEWASRPQTYYSILRVETDRAVSG